MIFSDKGKMYRLLVNDIPIGTNTTKGQPIKALISMENDENAQVIYSIYRDMMLSVLFIKQGMLKRFKGIKTKKKNAIN